MSRIEDGSVDGIITDPPYGTTACSWDSVIPFEPMWAQLKRIIKPRGAIVLFGSQPFTSALVMSNAEWFKQEIVWDKLSTVGFLNASRYMLQRHENMILFCGGMPTYNPQGLKTAKIKSNSENGSGKTKKGGVYGSVKNSDYFATKTNFPTTIHKCMRVTNNNKHSTQKPVPLLEYLVKTYTNENETVLDFTMGSGTTGVACARTKRKFIGIELDADYFNTAKARIEYAYNGYTEQPESNGKPVQPFLFAPNS